MIWLNGVLVLVSHVDMIHFRGTLNVPKYQFNGLKFHPSKCNNEIDICSLEINETNTEIHNNMFR